MRKDLLEPPEYFTVRENADGSLRFYWRASARIAKLIKDSPYKAVVSLGKDRGAAEIKCREITAGVNSFIRSQGARAPVNFGRHGVTLAAAIDAFKESPAYLDKAHDTRRQYDWMLARIVKWGGQNRISDITYKVACDAAASLKDQLRTREVFLMLLAMIIDHANMANRVPGSVIVNPVRKVLEEIERPEAKGGWVWPREAVVAMAAAADALGRPSIGTAIILNDWLGQRTGDILRLPRSAYREGVVHLVQSKTGKYVQLPISGALRARLDWQFAEEAKARGEENVLAFPGKAAADPRTLLICETTGEPWKIDHFRHEFARIRAALGLAKDAEPDDVEKLEQAAVWPIGGFVIDCPPKRLWKQMQDKPMGTLTVRTEELLFGHLRHTGITRLHQAGCSDEEIQAISGHDHPSTAYKHYIANTITRAVAAFARREEYERGAQ